MAKSFQNASVENHLQHQMFKKLTLEMSYANALKERELRLKEKELKMKDYEIELQAKQLELLNKIEKRGGIVNV